MSDDIMGPPWKIDWRTDAGAYRDSLPKDVRETLVEALVDVNTAPDPYRPGPDIPVEPERSTRFRGPHIFYFDSGRGWARFTFVRRSEDPQIVIEELFWQ
ncbi:hypothetical protein I5Q34_29650 [Streptomyces sp. AV19]|uniref:hypothetical protein n=1 Tax=Streptomyces sp. AV19 TaxID=2793068 RepID=UPI0018FEC9B1|nr:hypothetical protein [Streptomyces sp. AV19]MBH1938374.1 hypothetical protein [Streptomyces sp. AV19]MDG4535023.1 hypothetical protein [Streptomyces sp. AV19]